MIGGPDSVGGVVGLELLQVRDPRRVDAWELAMMQGSRDKAGATCMGRRPRVVDLTEAGDWRTSRDD